jgi:hypothetical protein
MAGLYNLLESFIDAEKEQLEAIKPGLTMTRVNALRELQRNGEGMSFAQINEVMTTANFASYFADCISRMFYSEYKLKSGTWKNYTFKDTALDFRDVKRWRMSMPEGLLLRREKAEQKATYIDEGDYINYHVEEYARQFDVSWRAIMNDDLGEIQQTPRRMGKEAGVSEDVFVSSLYDNATTQAGLIALGAVYAGTGRLTAANLAIGINAMASRADNNGTPLNIQNIILVVPTILEIQARIIMQSILMPGVATNDKNVLPTYISNVYVDPYIATAAPNVPWYLFAQPSDIPAVTVLRLQGYESAWIYKKASDVEMVMGSAPAPFLMGSFATGDVTYAVSDIYGAYNNATYVGVTDVNGIYYSSGTTP